MLRRALVRSGVFRAAFLQRRPARAVRQPCGRLAKQKLSATVAAAQQRSRFRVRRQPCECVPVAYLQLRQLRGSGRRVRRSGAGRRCESKRSGANHKDAFKMAVRAVNAKWKHHRNPKLRRKNAGWTRPPVSTVQ
eukprot:TRINITY_DN400_c0_g2_i1.p1 TRINITY_DN400_c0_g2~~TRINITY_DN400_c0_g2_i1.p1  ORF type:complete len:154 (+),score=23.33 TRINITY_DN400_c0_g2_i1:60-464(+)